MSLNKEERVPDIDGTENVALFVRRTVRVVLMVLGRRMVGWAGPAVGPVISMARVEDLHHTLHKNSCPQVREDLTQKGRKIGVIFSWESLMSNIP